MMAPGAATTADLDRLVDGAADAAVKPAFLVGVGTRTLFEWRPIACARSSASPSTCKGASHPVGSRTLFFQEALTSS
jgi:hypothetical protein